jgi:hypothetical protein
MTNAVDTTPTEEGVSRIKTHEMVMRIITVAELLKKSAHELSGREEIRPTERSKTQDSKAVVS